MFAWCVIVVTWIQMGILTIISPTIVSNQTLNIKQQHWISPLWQGMFQTIKFSFSETIAGEIIVTSPYDRWWSWARAWPASPARAPSRPRVQAASRWRLFTISYCFTCMCLLFSLIVLLSCLVAIIYLLPREVTMLEARDRVGGRVHTHEAGGMSVDLGDRKTDSIHHHHHLHHHHHHHPEGVVYRSFCLNSGTLAVPKVTSRRWWWCIESLFPGAAWLHGLRGNVLAQLLGAAPAEDPVFLRDGFNYF